jgi:DNA-binding transcriptional MerR regulator
MHRGQARNARQIDFYVNSDNTGTLQAGTACRFAKRAASRAGRSAEPPWAQGEEAGNMAARSEISEYFTITELTKEFGISTRTIRFYEDEGLINPVRRGRTRLFRPSDRRLLSFILRGKRLGFSIAEIREILVMYKEPPGEEGQLRLLVRRINEKRSELEQKRRDIEETLRELEQVEEASLTRMAELGVGT